MSAPRFEIWSDPDVGDWTVSFGDEVLADCLESEAEAEAFVRRLAWLDAVDADPGDWFGVLGSAP